MKISEKILKIFPLLLVNYEVSNYLANDAYLPALPQLAQDLGVSSHMAQLTLTLFFLGNATTQLFLGPLADCYGRRPILLGGGLCFLLGTILCATTSHIYWLLFARFIQGAAVTSMIITGYGTVHALYDTTQAIKTLAWMNSITVLAPSLGPLFGAILLLVMGWQGLFWVIALWAALGLASLAWLMPETCIEPVPLHPGKIAKSYWAILSNWGFMQPTLALFFLFSAMIAWITAGPFLIMEKFNYSSVVYGILQAVVFGCFIIGSHSTKRLINHFSPDTIAKIGATIAVIGGIVSISLAFLAKDLLIDLIVPMMLVALGSGIGFPVFNRLAIERSNETMGVKIAIFASATGLSALAGSAIVSIFYDGTVLGFSWIIFISSLITFLFYVFHKK